MEALYQQLQIVPGITAIMGSGGKTTMLYQLARELSRVGRVVVCTSTKLYPPQHLPLFTNTDPQALGQTVAAALETDPCCAVGQLLDGEPTKLGPPSLGFSELARLADYVLVEADGSKRLPAKAHADYEPVIPQDTTQVIALFGVSAIGQPINQGAHRSSLYAALCGASERDIITPLRAATVLNTEGLHNRLFVNQADLNPEAARRVALLANGTAHTGSLRDGHWAQVK